MIDLFLLNPGAHALIAASLLTITVLLGGCWREVRRG